jgi:hypothetical protein
MKLRCFFILIALLAGVIHVAAQGTTAFTYQGQLRDGGTNANGNYTMIFKLYDAATSGNQVGPVITSNLGLFNGLFSVDLDFGAGAFDGTPRWLDITVTNGPTTQTLSPRVPVLPTPYAQFAAIAATVTNGAITSAKIAIGAVSNANLAASSVGTANIQNNAITTAQIADAAIANRNLAGGSVNASNIAAGQVVKSINGLTDNVSLSLIGVLTAGANAVLFTNGNALQLSALVPHIQVFTTNGTFAVPTNVTRVRIDLWAGGGGGGKGLSSGWNGGGGGAGGYAFNVFNVIPGTNYAVTVGIGGTNGVAGTLSSIFGTLTPGGAGTNILAATGGGAGTNAVQNVNGAGGIGGMTTNSLISISGSAGEAGGSFGGGYGASAFGPLGGIGGLGGVPTTNNNSGPGGNGNGPGAGGGGSSAGSNPAPGGTGGPGLVIVQY